MTTVATTAPRSTGIMATLNGQRHKLALGLFMVVVIAHWAEHIAQAYQIWGLGWPRPKANGLLGLAVPVAGHIRVAALRVRAASCWSGCCSCARASSGAAAPGGRSRSASSSGTTSSTCCCSSRPRPAATSPAGRCRPASLQLFFPRVELHLFYNTIVFIPMVVAMVLHLRPDRRRARRMACPCARPRRVPVTA